MYLCRDWHSDGTRALIISICCPSDIRQCAPGKEMVMYIAMHGECAHLNDDLEPSRVRYMQLQTGGARTRTVTRVI